MDVSSASNRLLNASQDTFISDSGELYRLRFASGSPGVNDRIVSVFAFGSTNDTVRIVRNSSSEYTVRTGAGWYVIQVDQGGTPVISVQPLQTQKIQNGDFENGTNGWTVNTGVEAGAVLATNTAAQSPFSSGSAGFQMTDGTVNPDQWVRTDFGAQADGKYNLSFDYKMLAENNALWLGRIRNSGSSDISFDFSIGNTYLKVGTTSVATGLSTGTWYHVSMILDSANDKVLSGSITPYGGSATTWGQIAGSAITAQIKQLMITDNSQLNVAPSIYLDNVSLTVIPEPATIGMLGLGALITLLIRRQCMK
jgi:hypothetical protein